MDETKARLISLVQALGPRRRLTAGQILVGGFANDLPNAGDPQAADQDAKSLLDCLDWQFLSQSKEDRADLDAEAKAAIEALGKSLSIFNDLNDTIQGAVALDTRIKFYEGALAALDELEAVRRRLAAEGEVLWQSGKRGPGPDWRKRWAAIEAARVFSRRTGGDLTVGKNSGAPATAFGWFVYDVFEVLGLLPGWRDHAEYARGLIQRKI